MDVTKKMVNRKDGSIGALIKVQYTIGVMEDNLHQKDSNSSFCRQQSKNKQNCALPHLVPGFLALLT